MDPRAKVLIGELAPSRRTARAIAPLKFLRDVTCSNLAYQAAKRCAPLKADGFAVHPYQFLDAPHVAAGRPDDVPIGALSRLTTALDKLARRHALATPRGRKMELYLTEFGYLTAGPRTQKPKIRAAWLSSAFGIARRNPRVRQLLQYQLIDPPDDVLWHSAILDQRRLAAGDLRRPREGLAPPTADVPARPVTHRKRRRAVRSRASASHEGGVREDQGRHAVGYRSRLGDRRARSRRAQAGGGLDPLGGGGLVPLRRAPAPRRHRPALSDRRRP